MLLSNLTLEFRQFSIKIFYILIFKTSFYEMYVPEFQYDITGTSKELEGFIILKLNDVLSFLSFRKVAEFKSCKTCADPWILAWFQFGDIYIIINVLFGCYWSVLNGFGHAIARRNRLAIKLIMSLTFFVKNFAKI